MENGLSVMENNYFLRKTGCLLWNLVGFYRKKVVCTEKRFVFYRFFSISKLSFNLEKTPVFLQELYFFCI